MLIPGPGWRQSAMADAAGEAVVRHAGRLRSLAKTVTWRVAASADTFLLGFLVTGSFVLAGSIASLEVLTKMALYYLHERVWAHVDWGVR